MAPFLIYLGLPIVLAIGLPALPPGRAALAGLVAGVLAVLSSLIWAGDDGSGFGHLLTGVLAVAVSLAALVQLTRHHGHGARAGTLAAIVGCLALAAGVAILMFRRL